MWTSISSKVSATHFLTNTNPVDRDPQDKTSSNKASDHKNEGFLKSAWHKLTHQHDGLEPDAKPDAKFDAKPKDETKTDKDDEEPKKASGSG